MALAYEAFNGLYANHMGPAWEVGLLVIALVALIHSARGCVGPGLSWRLHGCLCAVLIAVALQCVPVGPSVLSGLTPARFEALVESGSISSGIGWVPISVTPSATFRHAVGAAGAVLLMTVIRALASRSVWASVVPLLCIGACEVFSVLNQPLGGIRGTFGNRNHLAGFLEMALPFALAVVAALSRRGRGFRPIFVMAVVALLGVGLFVSTVLSESRMGYAAALLGAVIVIGGTAVSIARRTSARAKAASAVPLVTLGVLAFFVLPSRGLIDRFGLIRDPMVPDTSRAEMDRHALGVIRSYPLTGCGYGAYESAARPFQDSLPTVNIDYAHNDYLQLTAELGIPAMLCLLAAAFFVVRVTWRNAKRAPSIDLRYRAIACLGAYAAIALHSFVDFNLYIPANLMTLAWIAGIGTAGVAPASVRQKALAGTVA